MLTRSWNSFECGLNLGMLSESTLGNAGSNADGITRWPTSSSPRIVFSEGDCSFPLRAGEQTGRGLSGCVAGNELDQVFSSFHPTVNGSDGFSLNFFEPNLFLSLQTGRAEQLELLLLRQALGTHQALEQIRLQF